MAFTHLFLVGIVGLCLEYGFAAQDICRKFDVGGPCHLLPNSRSSTFRNLEEPPTDSPYCTLVCSQGDAELFSSVCRCARNVTTVTTTTTIMTSTTTPLLTTTTTPLLTTTTMSTTTPRPVTCYYSSQRPARLSTITRRMYSGTAVTTQCDYPGVVTLFRVENGKFVPACMASTLDNNILLINEKNCLTWLRRYQLYALVDSYNAADLTTNITVIPNSFKKLDTSGTLGVLYTVQLSSSLTFNSSCIQPVCVPNNNIPATDIDLNDCRIIGFGDTSDTLMTPSSQLNEVKVKVSATSVTKASLTFTRMDKTLGSACPGDDGAPLICSHKTTEEWVTVGIITTSGYPCSKASGMKINVTSLLHEAPNKVYYNAIQKFKFADPDVFTAESNY